MADRTPTPGAGPAARRDPTVGRGRPVGVRTAADLRAERALSSSELRTLARDGALQRIRRGVYAPPAQLDARGEYLRQLDAAVVATQSGAVISHWSAAALWGLPLWRGGTRVVWLSRTGAAHGKVRRGVHAVRTSFGEGDLGMIDGVLVTSVARTVIDIALSAPVEWGVIVADDALHRRLVTLEELRESLSQARRRHGVGRARHVLALADARSESPLESLSRVQISRMDLPQPDLQVPILLHGVRVGVVDFAWEDFRTIGECDGESKYGELVPPGQTASSVIMAEKDRENRIHQARWWSTRWGWADAWDREALERRIRDAFDNSPWRASA